MTNSKVPSTPIIGASHTPKFFLIVALVAAAIVFLGFLPTYWIPVISGADRLSTLIHVHAIFFFGWTLLFVLQTAFVSQGRVATHRRVGVLGVLWSLGTITVGYYIALSTISRDLDAIDGSLGAVFTIIPFSQVCMFSCFIALGIATVKNSDVHKRFMTLAALVVLTPALARICIAVLGAPSVPLIFIVSNGIVVGVVWYDTRRNHRLHPVFLWGGIAILLIRIARVPFSMTSWWRSAAEAMTSWVG